MRKILMLVLAFVMSLGIVTLDKTFNTNTFANVDLSQLQEASLIPQEIVEIQNTAVKVIKVYQKKDLIGVLSSDINLDAFLQSVYLQEYEANFPGTKLGLGQDIFISEEDSIYVYENRDQEILDYIYQNDLFSVEADKIEFSNGAIVYVKSVELFEEAKDLYIGNFISRDAYNLIRNQQLPPELTSYGSREIGFSIIEKASYQRGLAPAADIMTSVSEIVYFLSYGYGTEIKTYQVEEYDTVEGIAYMMGLSPQQVITINNDKLKTSNQILEVGMELNVTYFNSPIRVMVTRERLAREIVYPAATQYVMDATMQEGFSVVQTREELGYKNVTYLETFVNGLITDSKLMQSIVIKQPVREVVRVGTKVVPGIGSGTFRWPLGADTRITCRWWCYRNHEGLDIAYNYNRYGPIYAADRGVVKRVGFSWPSGYNVWIDHNNGFVTLYAHMVRYPPVRVGQRVEKGEFIGNVGNTGRSTGPHLHFGVYLNNVAKDPCLYLSQC